VFAILAALCFLLALLRVHLGDVSLVTLGLLFVALHLVVPVGLPFYRPRPAPPGN
jgi:hypothetical protein